MKTVLITGAGHGLGKATAEIFLQNGYLVIAADILFTGYQEEYHDRYISIPLDVTSGESVHHASVWLRERGISIDLLINNAGIYGMYPLSEIATDELRRMLDTNALGSARMIRAFLPDLVKNRGRVVQISSESAKFPGLFQPYQVSKITLEALSKSIRQELALKGVGMVIIQPGAIRTQLSSDLEKHRNPVEGSVFDAEFEAFVRNTSRFVGRVLPPEKVARKVFHAATCRRPRYVYRINNNPLLTLMALLPDRLIDRMVVRMLKSKD